MLPIPGSINLQAGIQEGQDLWYPIRTQQGVNGWVRSDVLTYKINGVERVDISYTYRQDIPGEVDIHMEIQYLLRQLGVEYYLPAYFLHRVERLEKD